MNESLDPRVWAAIISSIMSMIIAILSWVNSNKTLKKNLLYQKELEQFKLKLNIQIEENRIKYQKSIDGTRIKLELGNEEIKNSLKSLHLAIKEVQNVKEILQLVLKSTPDSLDLEDIVNCYKEANETLSQGYQNSLGYLGELEKGIFHDAKNISLNALMYILEVYKKYKNTKDLPDDFYEKIRKYRVAFSDLQELFRDIRFEKLHQNL